MAARLRRELEADVAMEHARYGEFQVLVDDKVVIDVGRLSIFGILPSDKRIIDSVRSRLSGDAP